MAAKCLSALVLVLADWAAHLFCITPSLFLAVGVFSLAVSQQRLASRNFGPRALCSFQFTMLLCTLLCSGGKPEAHNGMDDAVDDSRAPYDISRYFLWVYPNEAWRLFLCLSVIWHLWRGPLYFASYLGNCIGHWASQLLATSCT